MYVAKLFPCVWERTLPCALYATWHTQWAVSHINAAPHVWMSQVTWMSHVAYKWSTCEQILPCARCHTRYFRGMMHLPQICVWSETWLTQSCGTTHSCMRNDSMCVAWLILVYDMAHSSHIRDEWAVSFAEYSLFYRALLQKRPVILRSLLIAATPYVPPLLQDGEDP